MGGKRSLRGLMSYVAVVALQFGFAGMYLISTFSLHHGLSHYIFVVYRHAAATLAIAPFALLLERKKRPKMTLAVFLRILALGLLEPVLDQNMYFLGMKYTSAAYASVAANVVPALTFVMAVIFRLEKIRVRERSSQAKVIGTVATLTGAMIMAAYKGPTVKFPWTGGVSVFHRHGGTLEPVAEQHWLAGALLLLGSTVSWSAFFILLTFTLKMYPAELSVTSLICVVGVGEGAAVALVMEKDRRAWALGWDSRLLACVYSGLICSGLAYYVQGVVSRDRGPVFTTAFFPLAMIITVALGSILLNEQIRLGSLIGAVTIVLGLYSVVWGKSKEPPSAEDSCRELPTVNSKAVPRKIGH